MMFLREEVRDLHGAEEVHWSTGTLLAIFFAASMLSALGFGLGYSLTLGKSVNQTSTAATSTGLMTGAHNFLTHVLHRAPAASARSAAPNLVAKSPSQVRTEASVAPARPALVQAPAEHSEHAAVVPAETAKTRPETSEAKTHYMVQVGAIGDRKDASRLVAELRSKGFHAGIYSSKHDKFLHVQIGPFADTEQAQSMRHRVVASGFHAILKSAS